MARRAPLTACALLAAALAGGSSRAGDDRPETLPARIAADRTLSGRARLDRDLEIPPGVTLRIMAGASIEVATPDALKLGDFPARVEIHVHGRLVVEGTEKSPVVIAPEGGEVATAHAAWQGIVLHADRMRTPDSALRGLKIAGAAEALVVTDGTPRAESCVFHTCRDAVLAACVRDANRNVVEPARRPEPEIEGCVFVGCKTGVFAELDGTPSVSRSSFVMCETAMGNERQFNFTSPVTSTGPHATRCFFLGNATAVLGSSVVENSLFVRNSVALRLTDFHGTYSQEIDRLAWRRNALWENARECDGEADVGEDNVFADPGIVGEVTSLALKDVAAPLGGFSFAATSPVRGTALDGGDPGPWGAAGRRAGARTWTSLDRALRTVLVLGPPEKVDLAHPPTVAPSAAGERVGDAWWVAFPVGDDGAFHRASLRLPSSSDTAFAAFTWTAPAGAEPGAAEIDADGVLALWRAGKRVAFPPTNLRFGSLGNAVTLAPGGPPSLLVHWKSGDTDPRIGLAIGGAANVVPAGDAPPLRLETVGFGPKNAGLRVNSPFHWDDLRRPGVVRVRFTDGTLRDAADLGVTLFDAKGTLRVDWPAGVAKAGAKFVVEGLRDPWGRPLAGQPAEADAEPRR